MKSTKAASPKPPEAQTPIALILEADRAAKRLTQAEYVELLVKTARRQFKARGLSTDRLDRFSFDGYRSWLRKRPANERDGFDEWYWWPVFAEVTGQTLAKLTEERFKDLDALPEMAGLRRKQAAAELRVSQASGGRSSTIAGEIQAKAVLDEAMRIIQEQGEANKALEAKVEEITEASARDMARIVELLESIGVKKAELNTVRAKTAATKGRPSSATKRR